MTDAEKKAREYVNKTFGPDPSKAAHCGRAINEVRNQHQDSFLAGFDWGQRNLRAVLWAKINEDGALGPKPFTSAGMIERVQIMEHLKAIIEGKE